MVQRDPWASSAISTVPTGAEFPSASEGGAQRVSGNAYDVRGSFSPGKMAAGTPKIQPDVALESARKRVAGLEAAISAMLSNGLDEKSAEIRSLQVSLTKAKRSAQEAPLEVQVKGAQEFIERAQKRLAAHDAVRTELEKELAEEQARLHRLRMQVEAMPKPQPVAQDLPPPEWVAEIQRLRAEVSNYKARARPVRDSGEAAQNVRAKAEKRSAGLMDDMPTDEQGLKSWLEDKNLEMRDALDVGDAEAISSLAPLIAKGAKQLGACCRQEISDEEFRSRSAAGEGRFAPY